MSVLYPLIVITESTEESEDDLVPEIKSFLPSNNYCSETVTYASNSFEEGKKMKLTVVQTNLPSVILLDLPAKDTSVAVTIEALLENLESDDEEPPMTPRNNINVKPNSTTIQNVIDDLETTPEKSDVETTINRPKSKYIGIGNNQMQIDAGQKNFGIKECKDCGFQYNVSNIRKFLLKT